MSYNDLTFEEQDQLDNYFQGLTEHNRSPEHILDVEYTGGLKGWLKIQARFIQDDPDMKEEHNMLLRIAQKL